LNPKWSAAGNQELDVRPTQEVGDDRRRAKQVLEIVENQQGLPLGEKSMDLIDQRPSAHLAQTKCRGDRG
jgi:hypothetical protein